MKVFCRHCGTKLTQDTVFCSKCGKETTEEDESAPSQATAPITVNNLEETKTRGKAPTLSQVGFYFGIASVILFEIGLIPLIGIIINIIALVQHKKNPRRWMPIVGLCLSVLYLAVNLGFRYARAKGYT